MAFLGRGKKADLIKLAETLEIEIPEKATIIQIKNAIVSDGSYEENFVFNLFDTILKERSQSEEREIKEKELQLEREIKEKELQLEREMKEKELQLEREYQLKQEQEKFALEKEERLKMLEIKEKEMKLKYDLEKLKVENGVNVNDSRMTNSGLSLNQLIPKFDPTVTDISLYLVIFERQVKKVNIEESNWVNHLIGLLPMEIVQFLAREPSHLAENYEHVKKILLQKFKLSAETFRQKFVQYQKKPEIAWKDFTFELKNYLNEWLAGMEVSTFDELKDLMVVDQLKKRAKYELKDHFIDKWPNLKSSAELVELFDNYDDVRKGSHKNHAKDFKGDKGFTAKTSGKDRNAPSNTVSESSQNADTDERNKIFEKRVKPRCFYCYSTDHLRPACPKLNKDRRVESISNVQAMGQTNFLKEYTSYGTINGKNIKILRDSAATIDLICRKYVNSNDFCGESVWVKQPLSLDLKSLPLAVVELSGDFGTIKTKAAVCENYFNGNRYLLGNRTAALLRKENNFEFFPGKNVKVGQTRSREEQLVREKAEKSSLDLQSVSQKNRERGNAASIRNNFDAEGQREIPNLCANSFENVVSIQAKPDTVGQSDIPNFEIEASENEISVQFTTDTEGKIGIPNLQEGAPELGSLRICKEKFIEAQVNSEDLTELFRQADDFKSGNKTYSVSNEDDFKSGDKTYSVSNEDDFNSWNKTYSVSHELLVKKRNSGVEVIDGSNLNLSPEIGGDRSDELVRLPIALCEENYVIAAVAPMLLCTVLITPEIYRCLTNLVRSSNSMLDYKSPLEFREFERNCYVATEEGKTHAERESNLERELPNSKLRDSPADCFTETVIGKTSLGTLGSVVIGCERLNPEKSASISDKFTNPNTQIKEYEFKPIHIDLNFELNSKSDSSKYKSQMNPDIDKPFQINCEKRISSQNNSKRLLAEIPGNSERKTTKGLLLTSVKDLISVIVLFLIIVCGILSILDLVYMKFSEFSMLIMYVIKGICVLFCHTKNFLIFTNTSGSNLSNLYWILNRESNFIFLIYGKSILDKRDSAWKIFLFSRARGKGEL